MALNQQQLDIIQQYHNKGGTAIYFDALPYPVREGLIKTGDNQKSVSSNVNRYLRLVMK